MATSLTFIIPVRHPANAVDWNLLTQRLQQTIRSVSAQDCADWRGVVVANDGADLPAMPPNWQVARVTFPANALHEQGAADKETFYEAFRLDKGRRVLAGILAARDSSYFMIVDDDDFVSRRLASYVSAHEGEIGWHIKSGYFWGDGSGVVYLHHEFSRMCGTSLIIRNDLYEIPDSIEDVDEGRIGAIFGSHTILPDMLAAAGTPLLDLPFAGAVYRIGHVGAHSKSLGLRGLMFSSDKTPLQAARRLLRVRPLTKSFRREFFGGATILTRRDARREGRIGSVSVAPP